MCFQWTPAQNKPPGDVDRLLKAFAESEVCRAADSGRSLAALWAAIRAVSEGATGLGEGARQAALSAGLIVGLAQRLSGQKETPEEVDGLGSGEATARQAIRFIHDNLNRPLPLREIAAQVYLSTRQVSRLLTDFAGLPPERYIARARLDRARALLKHTNLPIKEIAATVGYPEVAHFTRVITARFGCPPGTLRHHPEKGDVLNIQNSGNLVPRQSALGCDMIAAEEKPYAD